MDKIKAKPRRRILRRDTGRNTRSFSAGGPSDEKTSSGEVLQQLIDFSQCSPVLAQLSSTIKQYASCLKAASVAGKSLTELIITFAQSHCRKVEDAMLSLAMAHLQITQTLKEVAEYAEKELGNWPSQASIEEARTAEALTSEYQKECVKIHNHASKVKKMKNREKRARALASLKEETISFELFSAVILQQTDVLRHKRNYEIISRISNLFLYAQSRMNKVSNVIVEESKKEWSPSAEAEKQAGIKKKTVQSTVEDLPWDMPTRSASGSMDRSKSDAMLRTQDGHEDDSASDDSDPSRLDWGTSKAAAVRRATRAPQYAEGQSKDDTMDVPSGTFLAKAMYQYDGDDSRGDLSFKAGDLILVKQDDVHMMGQWWTGTLHKGNGTGEGTAPPSGQFPASYVARLNSSGASRIGDLSVRMQQRVRGVVQEASRRTPHARAREEAMRKRMEVAAHSAASISTDQNASGGDASLSSTPSQERPVRRRAQTREDSAYSTWRKTSDPPPSAYDESSGSSHEPPTTQLNTQAGLRISYQSPSLIGTTLTTTVVGPRKNSAADRDPNPQEFRKFGASTRSVRGPRAAHTAAPPSQAKATTSRGKVTGTRRDSSGSSGFKYTVGLGLGARSTSPSAPERKAAMKATPPSRPPPVPRRPAPAESKPPQRAIDEDRTHSAEMSDGQSHEEFSAAIGLSGDELQALSAIHPSRTPPHDTSSVLRAAEKAINHSANTRGAPSKPFPQRPKRSAEQGPSISMDGWLIQSDTQQPSPLFHALTKHILKRVSSMATAGPSKDVQRIAVFRQRPRRGRMIALLNALALVRQSDGADEEKFAAVLAAHPHVACACAVLKRSIKAVKGGLVPMGESVQRLWTAQSIAEEDIWLEYVQNVLCGSTIPMASRLVMKELLIFLHNLSKFYIFTSMRARNLALEIGPCIFEKPEAYMVMLMTKLICKAVDVYRNWETPYQSYNAIASFDYEAVDPAEMDLKEGQRVWVWAAWDEQWVFVQDSASATIGVAPIAFLEQTK